jgi:hypothetical protein
MRNMLGATRNVLFGFRQMSSCMLRSMLPLLCSRRERDQSLSHRRLKWNWPVMER